MRLSFKQFNEFVITYKKIYKIDDLIYMIYLKRNIITYKEKEYVI